MKSALAMMALLLLVSMNAYAESPFKVRGVALGDTKEQMQALHPDVENKYGQRSGVICPNPLRTTTCMLSGYADVSADVFYHLVDGRVESVSVRINNAGDFSGVMLTLALKHGPAQSETNEPVKNRMGATFSNRKFAWLDAASGQTLSAEERSHKVDESGIRLTSKAGVAAELARLKLSTEAAVDSL